MGFLELLLVAVGLSMDAFAVAVCEGLGMKKLNFRRSAAIAFFFGLFQGCMPLIGWRLGKQFERYITNVDHWIAFLLLSLIGGNMLLDALKNDNAEELSACGDALDLKELIILATATSIDALAIGVTFAFLPSSFPILSSVLIIGVITFVLSFAGTILGNIFGARYKNHAQSFGGLILIALGIKILLEHVNLML